MTATLILERKSQEDTGQLSPNMAMTPSLGETYWSYRVKLTDTQSLVGFPKFGTVVIGFAREEDWNTNLPYTCDAGEIHEHIAANKGDDSISREDCIAAIRLIQDAARAARRR
jgi:hypothetical protein